MSACRPKHLLLQCFPMLVAGVNNSILYGQATVKTGADGSLAQFRLRNSNDTKDTYKINNDGSVNSYGSYL